MPDQHVLDLILIRSKEKSSIVCLPEPVAAPENTILQVFDKEKKRIFFFVSGFDMFINDKSMIIK